MKMMMVVPSGRPWAFALSLLLLHPKLSNAFVPVAVSPRPAFLQYQSASHDETTTPSSSTISSSLPHSFVAEQTRPDFPILHHNVTDDKPLIYLDSGATSQKPQQVLDATEHYYTYLNSNVHRGAHTLSRRATAAYEAARTTVADFVNARQREEIVFTSGATEAINLVAQTFGRTVFEKGDEIILTVAEHHANLVPWQLLAQEKNLTIKYVPLQDGAMNLSVLESLLNAQKTKLVAFPHVSNVLGCIHPVRDIVAAVRSKCPNAKILIDACQSVPHMSVSVQDLDVDFLVASGHKLCGPTGIGFLWGRYELLEQMPAWKGGGEMIQDVTLQGCTFQPPPGRFEAGTPAIAQAVGLAAAIEYLRDTVGMDKIEAYEHELAEYLYERLTAVPGITVLGPTTQRAALCAFSHETIHPSDLSTFLDMDGIAVRAGHHCCQPLHTELGFSHSVRASLYFYNTKEEIDIFIESLEKTIKFFEGMESTEEDKEDDFVPFI